MCKLIQNKSSLLEHSKTASRCDSTLTGAILMLTLTAAKAIPEDSNKPKPKQPMSTDRRPTQQVHMKIFFKKALVDVQIPLIVVTGARTCRGAVHCLIKRHSDRDSFDCIIVSGSCHAHLEGSDAEFMA